MAQARIQELLTGSCSTVPLQHGFIAVANGVAGDTSSVIISADETFCELFPLNCATDDAAFVIVDL